MVSKSNLAIGGLVLLLLGFIVSRRGGGGNDSIPTDTPQNPNAGKISLLESELSKAREFFNSTFKAPNIPTGINARGPNFVGNFGAKGVISGLDPFTGNRTVLGFTERASGKTRQFFGEPQTDRIQFGRDLKQETQALIDSLTGRIGLLTSGGNQV